MEKAYIIINENGTPLRYFFNNGNCHGKMSDFLAFSNSSYFVFSSKEEAESKIEKLKEQLDNIEIGTNRDNHKRTKEIFSKLKVVERL